MLKLHNLHPILIVMQSEGESMACLLLTPCMDQFGVTVVILNLHISCSFYYSATLVLLESTWHGCQVGQDLYARFLTCSQSWHFYFHCSGFPLLQLH